MRFTFLLFLLAAFNSASAQDQGMVRFFVEVDNGYFEIEINDTLLLKRYKDTLPVGTYDAKVWSPGYVTTNIEFEIKKNQTTEMHVEMAKNNEYIQYEYDYNAYRMQFHKHLTAPVSITTAVALVTGGIMIRGYDTRKQIITDIDLYNKTPLTSEIDEIKARVALNEKRYSRQRFGYYFGVGLTAVGIGSTIWLYRKFKKNYTEPTFTKESPFKDKFSLTVTPYGCGLAFKL